MEKVRRIEGVAAPLPIVNIDTDMIIPKQFLKTIKRSGLGKALFHEMRYNEDGSENPDFVLNQEAYREASILIAGDNFGCGSSREHAPWALKDFGIKAIIAPSFADIFYNNCFQNGMLPVRLSEGEVEHLMKLAQQKPGAVFIIDLEAQEVQAPDDSVYHFDIDPFRKHCLMEGLDDIGLTLQKEEKIAAFERQYAERFPWL